MTKILIVDDDKLMQGALAEMIEDHFQSVQVFMAKTCSQAYIAIKSHNFDLIIIDLIIPGGSKEWILSFTDLFDEFLGMALLKQIRTFDKSVKVIFYSVSEDEVVSKSLAVLNASYVCKLSQTGFEEIRSQVNEVINQSYGL